MSCLFCTPVLVAGVLMLVPGVGRAQSIGSDAPAPILTGSQAAAVARHWRNEWFRDRDYFDPLIAEPRTADRVYFSGVGRGSSSTRSNRARDWSGKSASAARFRSSPAPTSTMRREG